MKDIELIDYTGNIWGSHFIYLLPGNGYKPGEEYRILIERLPMGTARIAAVTQVPVTKISDTVARLFMGKTAEQVRTICKRDYLLKDDDTISILAIEWLKIDSDGLKAMMEVRFDAMKGLNRHERQLKLEIS